MSAPLTLDEVERRFGLEPIPEGVERLTKLLARQNAHLDTVTDIVRDDKLLTLRLLRSANPHASRPEEYTITTVKNAVLQNGLCVLFLLAAGDPAARAIGKTFRHMLGVEKVALLNANSLEALKGEHFLGEVDFNGRTEGSVRLRMAVPVAYEIARRLLDLKDAKELSDTDVHDALAEVANIVAGNFQSNLRDAGFECRLQTPRVSRTSDFKLRTVLNGASERMAFDMPGITIYLDLSINPWNEKRGGIPAGAGK